MPKPTPAAPSCWAILALKRRIDNQNVGKREEPASILCGRTLQHCRIAFHSLRTLTLRSESGPKNMAAVILLLFKQLMLDPVFFFLRLLGFREHFVTSTKGAAQISPRLDLVKPMFNKDYTLP